MVEKVNEYSSMTGVRKVLDENFEIIVNGRHSDPHRVWAGLVPWTSCSLWRAPLTWPTQPPTSWAHMQEQLVLSYLVSSLPQV